MNKQKFEPCTLGEATHVEMGSLVYKLGQDEFTSEHQVLKYNDYNIEVHKGTYSGNIIHVNAFPLLGIKPLKEKKPEPIEFEFIPSLEMVKDSWLGEHIPMEAIGKKFKCVQILEDEKK